MSDESESGPKLKYEQAPSAYLAGAGFERVEDGSESEGVPRTFEVTTGMISWTTAWDEQGEEWRMTKGDYEAKLLEQGFTPAAPMPPFGSEGSAH